LDSHPRHGTKFSQFGNKLQRIAREEEQRDSCIKFAASCARTSASKAIRLSRTLQTQFAEASFSFLSVFFKDVYFLRCVLESTSEATRRVSKIMATTTIEARCNARPTRMAFILPHPDRNLLLSVFARATSLWGGIFNPIVILDDSTRKTNGVHYTMSPPDPYMQMQADMLRAFDPDILVNYSTDPLPPELKPWQHRTFPASSLDWRPLNSDVMSYFVDVFPIFDELWNKEFKGITNPRFKIKFVEKTESEKSLFLAGRFGLYSSDDYYEFLRKSFDAETLVYDSAFR
jgi:hypothetical protein